MGNLVARLIQHKPHWPSSASAARGLMAMMPLLFLSAYWLGGERALIAAALLLPLTGLILPQARLPGLPYGPDHTTPMTAQAFRCTAGECQSPPRRNPSASISMKTRPKVPTGA